MSTSRGRPLAVIVGIAVAGCGATSNNPSPPANVAGRYTIAVTSGANGCAFQGWTEGSTAANIPLMVTQNGTLVEATVGGATGIYLNLLYGSNRFSGTVSGATMSLSLLGMRALSQGHCAYTLAADVTATVGGTVLMGTIRNHAQTNAHADCAELNACSSLQTLSGFRPSIPDS